MAKKAKIFAPTVTTGAAAKEPARKKGRPPFVNCRVLLGNLWTSKGKFLKGDEVMLPDAEAATYDRADKVKIVRQDDA